MELETGREQFQNVLTFGRMATVPDCALSCRPIMDALCQFMGIRVGHRPFQTEQR